LHRAHSTVRRSADEGAVNAALDRRDRSLTTEYETLGNAQ
jgi:hypothetical protein